MDSRSSLFSLIPIAFVVIVIVYEKFIRQKKIRDDYDEMQLSIRGKGAWYGFYILIVYLGVLYVLEGILEFRFLTGAHAVFLGIMLSGSVIAGYSILHDSYYGMNRSRSRNYPFFAVLIVIEAVSIFYLIRLVREGMFSDLRTACADDRLRIRCVDDRIRRLLRFPDFEALPLTVHDMAAELSDDPELFGVGVPEHDLVDRKLLIPLQESVDKNDSAHARAADYADFHDGFPPACFQ